MALLVIVLVVLPFAIAAWLGAPYLPTLRRDYGPALELTNLQPGQTLIDLGSGDGRLLRAAAQRGVRGIGYEINPFIYAISLIVTWRYRHLITIHLADFWRVPLPPANAVYVFLIDRFMAKLDIKLQHELKQPTPVISFVFKIPGRVVRSQTRNAWLYDYPAQPAPASK